MVNETTVEVPRDILEAIYEGAKQLYPRESFLILRGKKRKGIIRVSDLIVAPFAVHGDNYATFQPYMLPGDFSLIVRFSLNPGG